MKTRFHPQPSCSLLSSCPPILALLVLLAALSARADTNFTSTNLFTGFRDVGFSYSDSSGLSHEKGIVQVQPELADDPRATGRLTSWTDIDYQPDGTATLSGRAYLEVGIWDATCTNFGPSGEVWALNVSGVRQTNGDTQFTMTGYGIGGTIERMRFSETVTMIPGPMVPRFVGSGTIKPAPVNTRVVVDDFSDGVPWSLGGGGLGTYRAIETNGVFTIVGDWGGHPTGSLWETAAWAGKYTNWSVPEGQTLEVRVDLVNMNEAATGVNLVLYHANAQGYGFFKEGDALARIFHS